MLIFYCSDFRQICGSCQADGSFRLLGERENVPDRLNLTPELFLTYTFIERDQFGVTATQSCERPGS